MMYRFLQSQKNRLPEDSTFIWLFATLIALAVCRAVYFSFDLTLKNFSGRIIGLTVLEGINAPARINQFYMIAAIFAVVLFAVYLSFSFLFSKWQSALKSPRLKIDMQVLFILSSFACIAIFLNVLHNFRAYNEVVIFLEFLTGLDVCIMAIKSISFHKGWALHRLFANYAINILALFFPLVLFFLGWFLFSLSPVFQPSDLAWYLLLWLAFYLIYFIIQRWAARSGRLLSQVDQALLIAAIPFLCIPATFSLDNEVLYFLFLKGVKISPKIFVLSGIVFLIILGLVLLVRTLQVGNKKFRISAIVYKIYFPIFLLTSALLVGYLPSVNYSTIDTFHLGENMIVAQQVFQFHRIPYIDILPTHGLSETIYDLLYSCVFGYRPVEQNIWIWMDNVVFSLIFYFFTKKIFPPLAAFLLTWLLPFGIFLPSFYSFMLVAALSIYYFLENKNRSRYWIGSLVSLWMFLWRVDFGMATMAALLCVAAVECLFRLLYKEKGHLFQSARKVMSAFVVVFGGFLLLLFLTITLRGGNFLDLMQQDLLFIEIQTQSLSVPVLGNFSSLFILEYMVLPLVGIYFVMLFLYQQLTNNRITPSLVVLAFLAFASLFLMTRTLQRHSVGGKYNPVMFVFLAVLTPFSLGKLAKNSALLFSLGIMAAYLAIFPANSQNNLVKTDGPYIHIMNFTRTQQRVQYQLNNDNIVVADFLKTNLHGAQTFLDLSNDPFLYIETGRRHLFYLIPNLLFTGDELQNRLITKIEQNRIVGNVPFVVFRQGNSWDLVDGVPNEVRSYRITEYIYKHYRPYIRVNRFELWVDKTLDTTQYDISDSPQVSSLGPVTQRFDLKLLPYIWGTYDKKSAVKPAEVQEVIVDHAVLLRDGKAVFPVSSSIDKDTGNYLSFRIKSPEPAVITVRYSGATDASSIIFQTKASPEYQTYLVRVSTQWQWMSEAPEQVYIEASTPVSVEYIAILRGD